MSPNDAQQSPRSRILQYNPAGEPFIRLHAPFEHLILTPSRQEDVPYLLRYLNDPKILNWLTLPNPYLPEHATGWIKHEGDMCNEVLEQVKAAEADDSVMVGGIPLNTIREVKADGTEEPIGKFEIVRCTWSEVTDEEKRKDLQDKELSKQIGDPEICWQIGDWLAPQYHGKGIMSAVIQLIIYEWGVPWMNLKYMRCIARQGNVGSVRVLEKSGFRVVDSGSQVTIRGEPRTQCILELRI